MKQKITSQRLYSLDALGGFDMFWIMRAEDVFHKTYEVAIDSQRLKALDISLPTVFKALEDNNSVAGGGYIEKTNETFFIRAEGQLASIEDIESIVVQNRIGIPIYLRDTDWGWMPIS